MSPHPLGLLTSPAAILPTVSSLCLIAFPSYSSMRPAFPLLQSLGTGAVPPCKHFLLANSSQLSSENTIPGNGPFLPPLVAALRAPPLQSAINSTHTGVTMVIYIHFSPAVL